MQYKILGYYYLHKCGSVIWAPYAKVMGNGGESEYFSPGGLVVDYQEVPERCPAEGRLEFFYAMSKNFLLKSKRADVTLSELLRISKSFLMPEELEAYKSCIAGPECIIKKSEEEPAFFNVFDYDGRTDDTYAARMALNQYDLVDNAGDNAPPEHKDNIRLCTRWALSGLENSIFSSRFDFRTCEQMASENKARAEISKLENEANSIVSNEHLVAFIDKLLYQYKHSYYSAPVAVGIAMMAVMHRMTTAMHNSVDSGFSCNEGEIAWYIFHKIMRVPFDTPVKMIQLSDLLYPNNQTRVEKTVTDEDFDWLLRMAAQIIKDNKARPPVYSDLINAHLEKMISSKELPYGYVRYSQIRGADRYQPEPVTLQDASPSVHAAVAGITQEVEASVVADIERIEDETFMQSLTRNIPTLRNDNRNHGNRINTSFRRR